MGYHYDPIMCMNVPDSTSKTKDAKPLSKMDMNELRALYVSLGGDIKRTYGTSKQAMILKIDDLKRKGKDVPQNSLDKAIDENYIVSGMKSQLGQMLKRYKDPKNRNQLVSQYIGIVNNHRVNGKVTEEEFNEFVKYAKGLIGGSHDSLDKALRTCDKFTVWESDDYDDIYVSYENGTYVLYVDGRPQADGPQQRMIQLAKQEERMRD